MAEDALVFHFYFLTSSRSALPCSPILYVRLHCKVAYKTGDESREIKRKRTLYLSPLQLEECFLYFQNSH